MKLGIIGTNFISEWFSEAARRVEGVELSAVYSRTAERGRAFAEANGVQRVYDSLDGMLSSDIDAVYVASPTFMHGVQSIAAMRAGKHVLVEKMMAPSFSVAERMAECADKCGVVLLEAMRPAFDPSTDAIRSAIGRIGRVRRAHLEYCQYSSRYDKFKSGVVLNAFDPTICNSALADIGIYPLHMAVSYFGKPVAVRASSVLLENGFEGEGTLALEYDGMLCEVSYSKITESVSPSVIDGEEGSVVFDRINGPRKIELHHRGGTVEQIAFPYVEKNMSYEIAAFCDMVEGKRDSKPYLDVSLEAVRIATEAYNATGAVRYMNKEFMI
ncbi:MAG: Gfo/Idh/MocA family oxidoreductase [Clostridia bacterium]|nr:Gfo/Idh/MocA family oxidoreductase [Clostridia bacterium]MBQ8371729.1 Gfo/Idh/MocA family oxidoreductase [Clostridia bacterium]